MRINCDPGMTALLIKNKILLDWKLPQKTHLIITFDYF